MAPSSVWSCNLATASCQGYSVRTLDAFLLLRSLHSSSFAPLNICQEALCLCLSVSLCLSLCLSVCVSPFPLPLSLYPSMAETDVRSSILRLNKEMKELLRNPYTWEEQPLSSCRGWRFACKSTGQGTETGLKPRFAFRTLSFHLLELGFFMSKTEAGSGLCQGRVPKHSKSRAAISPYGTAAY